MKQVIFNADDFGRSDSINAAVLRSHQKGVLTSASLMVSGDAFSKAVTMARQNPNLATGLHLVTINGNALLSHREIPHLVDIQGRFPEDAVWTGLRYFFSQRAQKELLYELSAQFESFAQTGLPITHVNGHLNMHVHPALFDHVIDLAEQYNAHGLRLPRDDFWLARQSSSRQLGLKLAWAIIFKLLSRWCLNRLSGHSLKITPRVYGLLQSGHMSEIYVLKLLQNQNINSAEIYFHPDISEERIDFGPNSGDLSTLMSPKVKSFIQQNHIQLITYSTLD
jgi:hopanoid biosynthesis associated protein HpnK